MSAADWEAERRVLIGANTTLALKLAEAKSLVVDLDRELESQYQFNKQLQEQLDRLAAMLKRLKNHARINFDED